MFVRAIHDQPASQRFRDEGRAIHGQVNAKHQALATDFPDEIEFVGKFFNTGTQFRATLANICKQPFFLDYREEFKRCSTNKRATAEGGTVHSWCERCRKFLVRDKSAQRQPACQRFRYGHHIGKRAKRLIRKVSAGPAESALNLVGDQRSVVLRSEFARALPKFLADWKNPALALDRFYNKRANRIIKLALEIGDIVEPYEFRCLERAERRVHDILPGT